MYLLGFRVYRHQATKLYLKAAGFEDDKLNVLDVHNRLAEETHVYTEDSARFIHGYSSGLKNQNWHAFKSALDIITHVLLHLHHHHHHHHWFLKKCGLVSWVDVRGVDDPCKNLSPSSKFFHPCWVCWADSAEAFFFEQLIELLYSGSIVQSCFYPFEHRLKLGTQTFDLYRFSFGVISFSVTSYVMDYCICSCLPLVLKRGINLLAQNLFISSCFILGLCIFGVFHDHHFYDEWHTSKK